MKTRWRYARIGSLSDGTYFALSNNTCRRYVLVTRDRDGFIKYRYPGTIKPTFNIWQDRNVWVQVTSEEK